MFLRGPIYGGIALCSSLGWRSTDPRGPKSADFSKIFERKNDSDFPAHFCQCRYGQVFLIKKYLLNNNSNFPKVNCYRFRRSIYGNLARWRSDDSDSKFSGKHQRSAANWMAVSIQFNEKYILIFYRRWPESASRQK